ncbi:hypothetical protein SHAM105786_11620 [Shewanella amazonensis]
MLIFTFPGANQHRQLGVFHRDGAHLAALEVIVCRVFGGLGCGPQQTQAQQKTEAEGEEGAHGISVFQAMFLLMITHTAPPKEPITQC